MCAYRRPSTTVIILGDPGDRVLEKLRGLLARHGPQGLRIYLVSSPSAKSLENVKDIILSNYTFTLEIYTVSWDSLSKVIEVESKNIVHVLTQDPSIVVNLPGSMRELVEVV